MIECMLELVAQGLQVYLDFLKRKLGVAHEYGITVGCLDRYPCCVFRICSKGYGLTYTA